MKKIIILLLFILEIFSLNLVLTNHLFIHYTVFAQQPNDPGGEQPVDPGGGKPCDPTDPIGCIDRPQQLKGTLIGLFSNILRLIMTGGGIYAFIRIVLAGLKFMSAGGDTKAITAAWDSIWQSLLGVIIIISSVVLAALMGQLLFNDPTAILVPKVYGPGP